MCRSMATPATSKRRMAAFGLRVHGGEHCFAWGHRDGPFWIWEPILTRSLVLPAPVKVINLCNLFSRVVRAARVTGA